MEPTRKTLELFRAEKPRLIRIMFYAVGAGVFIGILPMVYMWSLVIGFFWTFSAVGLLIASVYMTTAMLIDARSDELRKILKKMKEKEQPSQEGE